MVGLAGVQAIVMLLAAVPAQAHDERHAFESSISSLEPARLGVGIQVRVLDHDSQVELTNASGRTVIVIGYEGEPYARVESAGPVFLNVRSPALPLSNDRWGRTPPTGSEDAAAPPRWVRVGDRGKLSWFDRRAQFRGSGTPARVTDPASRQKLWDYRIPLLVGDERAEIRGTLYWTGRRPFPIAVFLVLLIATAACALFGAWVLKRLNAADAPPPSGPGPQPTR